MDPLSTVIKFFQDCGLFIYPSALIMALGVTIAVERFIFLTKARTQNRKPGQPITVSRQEKP